MILHDTWLTCIFLTFCRVYFDLVFLQYYCQNIFFVKFIRGKPTMFFVQIKINSSDSVTYFSDLQLRYNFFLQLLFTSIYNFFSKSPFPTLGRHKEVIMLIERPILYEIIDNISL